MNYARFFSRIVKLIAPSFVSWVALVLGSIAFAQPIEDTQLEEFIEFAPGTGTAAGFADPADEILEDLVESGEVERGLISRLLYWNTSKPLKVCFFGGSQDLRRKIARIARDWELEGSTIRFDFGDSNDPRECGSEVSQIRVGYAGKGYWSAIGQDSMRLSQDEITLNLQGWNRRTPSSRVMRRKVLHEFGHALGFTHEHNRCRDEMDPEKVYAYYWRTQRWDREETDKNVLKVIDYSAYVASEFDPLSIMAYPSKASLLKDGRNSPCYISRESSSLSQSDIKTALEVYSVEKDFEADFSETTDLLAEGMVTLSDAERSIIEERLEFLAMDAERQSEIIGELRPEFVDVDVFACSDDEATQNYVKFLAEAVASQPKIGRFRVRRNIFPEPLETFDGVTIIADFDHPELEDAKRLAANVGAYMGDDVELVENGGAVSRWYLSVVGCRG